MPNETQNEKKEFDPTMSFSFFGSWFETVERLRGLQGIEAAYNLFTAIANYSMYYDIPNFENGSVVSIFWPMIQREIDLSLKRRGANFFSEEAEERRQQVIAAYTENPSLTVRDIAKMTGLSKSAVGRILQKLKDDVTEVGAEKEGEPERVLEPEQETDTMGLGQGGTVGQQAEIEEPCFPPLDKTFDYLWEKYSYGKDTITFNETGDGIVEIDPALFYIPPEAWESKGKSPCAEHPVSIQSGGSDTEDGDGELPF